MVIGVKMKRRVIEKVSILICLILCLSFVVSCTNKDDSLYVDILKSVPEQYKKLEGVKAIGEIQKKHNEKSYIRMYDEASLTSSEIAGIIGVDQSYVAKDGSVCMEMEYYFDYTGDIKKQTSIISMVLKFDIQGQPVENEIISETLVLGDEKYEFDHPAKKYYELDMEIPENIVGVLLEFSNVTSSETKKEIVDGVKYNADWFAVKDGSPWGILSKDGEASYISIYETVGERQIRFDMKIEYGDDISAEDFKIPEGYTDGDLSESFQA